MLEWLKTTVGVSISGGLLLAFLGFLAKNWFLERLKNSIKSEYDKELETHKADLKRDYDVQIEKLRADAAQNNIKLTRVFEKQAEVIAETYQYLVGLREAAIAASANMPQSETDYVEIWNGQQRKFSEYFHVKRIYLPRETRKNVHVFVTTLDELVHTGGLLKSSVSNMHTNQFQEMAKRVRELYAENPKLLSDLEDDFQRILGFPIEDSRPVSK